MGAFLSWLIVGTVSGATALALGIDAVQALIDPAPVRGEDLTLEVGIAVVSMGIFAATIARVTGLLRRRERG